MDDIWSKNTTVRTQSGHASKEDTTVLFKFRVGRDVREVRVELVGPNKYHWYVQKLDENDKRRCTPFAIVAKNPLDAAKMYIQFVENVSIGDTLRVFGTSEKDPILVKYEYESFGNKYFATVVYV